MYLRAVLLRVINQAKRKDDPLGRIKLLKKELDVTPNILRPVFDTFLGLWLWDYALTNRYKLNNRTTIDSADMAQWGFDQFLNEVKLRFKGVLTFKKDLQTIKLIEVKKILKAAKLVNFTGESVYNLLLSEMVKLYKTAMDIKGSSYDQKKINKYYLQNIDKFITIKLDSSNSNSLLDEIMKLYHLQMKSYLSQKNYDRAIIIEIERILFLDKFVVSSIQKRKIKKNLEYLLSKFLKEPASSRIVYMLAKRLKEQGESQKAYRVCNTIHKTHYDTVGAKKCRNLKKELVKTDYYVTIDSSINFNNSEFYIKYKNLERVYVRIVKDDWTQYLKTKWRNIGTGLKKGEIQKKLAIKPVEEFKVELDKRRHFALKTKRIKMPALANGNYIVFISKEKKFTDSSKNKVVYGKFWKTNTSVVVKGVGNTIYGVVVESNKGYPLKGKAVLLYKRDRKGIFNYSSTLDTDKDGVFYFKVSGRGPYIIFVKSKDTGDILFKEMIYPTHLKKQAKGEGLFLISSKSLYLPGEKVSFKGICYGFDKNENIYKVRRCKTVDIKLKDSNGTLIKSKKFDANSFGSLWGDFEIPKDVLLGKLKLESPYARGAVSFNVEECKLPKFKVVLNKDNKQLLLEGDVLVTGFAKTFNDIPIENAVVKYRVDRSYRSFFDYFRLPFKQATIISSGSTKTDENGRFQINFLSIPDYSIKKEFLPVFRFNVTAEVQSGNGEVRKGNMEINLGYQGLFYDIETPNWITSHKQIRVKVNAKNIQGMLTPFNAKLSLYKLKIPKYAKRLLKINNLVRKSSSSKQIESWEIDQNLAYRNIKTKSGKVEYFFKLKQGAYLLKVQGRDRNGNLNIKEKRFIVFNKMSSEFYVRIPSFFKVQKNKAHVGEELEAFWATGYRGKTKVYIVVLHDNQIIKSYWSDGKNSKQIKFKITEQMIGGINLQAYFIHKNQIYHHSKYIEVPVKDRIPKVKFVRFKKIYQPGAFEKIILKVDKKSGYGQRFEFLGLIYDTAIDQIKSHKVGDFNHLFRKDPPANKYRVSQKNEQLRTWYSRLQIPYEKTKEHNISFDPKLVGLHRPQIFRKESMFDSVALSGNTKRSKSIRFNKQAPAAMSKNQKQKNISNKFLSKVIFVPNLVTNERGEIEFKFKVPKGLSQWVFKGFLHSKNLDSLSFTKKFITSQPLMLFSNIPRFAIEGDIVNIKANVTNQTGGNINVKAEVDFFKDGINITNDLVSTRNKEMKFSSKEKTKTINWEINLDKIIGNIFYKIKISSGKFKDSNSGHFATIPKKKMVNESIAFWVDGDSSKEIEIKKVVDKENDIINKKIQINSSPLWSVVSSFPSVLKDETKSCDSLFNKYYIYKIGKALFVKNDSLNELLKNKLKLINKSSLLINQKYKNVKIENTPWVNQANEETERWLHLKDFTDISKIENKVEHYFAKLKACFLKDRGWPWFPGGRVNEHITLKIFTGLATLYKSNNFNKIDYLKKVMIDVDKMMQNYYQKIKHKDKWTISSLVTQYLYSRSLLVKKFPIRSKYKKMFNFFSNVAKGNWIKTSALNEVNIAVALYYQGDKTEAGKILKSLEERALIGNDKEIYWKNNQSSIGWHSDELIVHCRIIELFQLFNNKKEQVSKMKKWLLKHKRVNMWKTTSSTLSAIKILIKEDKELLSKNNNHFDVYLNDKNIKLSKSLERVGVYEDKLKKLDFSSSNKIKIVNKKRGDLWGGVFYNYFTDTPNTTGDRSLAISKNIYLEQVKNKKIELVKKKQFKVGDTLVVRLEIKLDQPMDFLYLNVGNVAGLDPVDQLSGHFNQGNLHYYRVLKKHSYGIYFEQLTKGNHILELRYKAFHIGVFDSGMTFIRSHYAPEFSSYAAKKSSVLIKE